MFNLQLFGTDDTVKTAYELKINTSYEDADTRLLTLKNPRNDLTGQEIKDAFTDVTVSNILVGDKNSSAFAGISEAYKLTKVTRDLDLTPDE